MFWTFVFIVILSYLLGSIPAAYLACKLKLGKDIRTMGSGNMGTTNAFRVLGPGLGIAVFAVDVMKAWIAVYIGKTIGGVPGGMLSTIFVVTGHMWPVWLDFRGGKGMACGCGILLALLPYHALVLLPLFAVVLLLTGYVSLASLSTAVVAPFLAIFFHIPWQYELVLIVIVIGIIYKHRTNWHRIREGVEYQFRFAVFKNKPLSKRKPGR